MGYMIGQGLLKTLLLTVTGLTSAGVTEGDARVLDSGRDYCAILWPGNVVNYDLVGMVREVEWEAILEIYMRFKDDTSYFTFGTFRDTVIAAMDTGRALSATQWMTAIRSMGPPADVLDKSGNGPFFITQQLSVTIVEQV